MSLVLRAQADKAPLEAKRRDHVHFSCVTVLLITSRVVSVRFPVSAVVSRAAKSTPHSYKEVQLDLPGAGFWTISVGYVEPSAWLMVWRTHRVRSHRLLSTFGSHRGKISFTQQVVVILKSLIEDGQLALPDGRRPRGSGAEEMLFSKP